MINRFVIAGLVISQSLLIHAADEEARKVREEEKLALSRAVKRYKEDFSDFKDSLEKQKQVGIEQIKENLRIDYLYLNAILGSASQVRHGAVLLFKDLSQDSALFKQFCELNNYPLIENVLNRIESYKGADDFWKDVQILSKEGKPLTESATDEPLVLAIARLDEGIKEAKASMEQPQAGGATAPQPVELVETQPTDLLQSMIGGTIMHTETERPATTTTTTTSMPPAVSVFSVAVKTSKTGIIPTTIDLQIRMIKSWPEDKKQEKIGALQLLAASEYNRLRSEGKEGGEGGTRKFIETARIFKELYELGSSIPSVRVDKTKRQKYYNIDGVGFVSEKQLGNYEEKGRGNILAGFCSQFEDLNKTMKRTREAYKQNPSEPLKRKLQELSKRHDAIYNICFQMRSSVGMPEGKKSMMPLGAMLMSTWINRMPQEPSPEQLAWDQDLALDQYINAQMEYIKKPIPFEQKQKIVNLLWALDCEREIGKRKAVSFSWYRYKNSLGKKLEDELHAEPSILKSDIGEEYGSGSLRGMLHKLLQDNKLEDIDALFEPTDSERYKNIMAAKKKAEEAEKANLSITATTPTPSTGQTMQPTVTTTTTTAAPTTTTTTTPAAPPTLPITPTPLPAASATLTTATTQPKPQPVTTMPQPTVSIAQPKPTPTPRGFFATVWDSAWNAATAVITAPFRLVTYVFNGIWSFFGGK